MKASSTTLLVLTSLLLAGCASPSQDAGGGEYVPVAGFSDVHGIAVNPERPDELYVATHNGLIRGKDGAWARVGSMQDDLMGFSMHPANGSTFWTSGHPRTGGNMGVRLSTDGGFTWRTLSLEGVDFHAMTISPADPNVLWGSWRGETYHSADAGNTWNQYPNGPTARSLTAHPKEKDTLYAMTQAGITRSTDAGKTWTSFAQLAAVSLAIDPTNPNVMYAGLADGLTRSLDAGRTWTRTSLTTASPVGYVAIDPTNTANVYAATYATSVHETKDGGGTWTTLKEGR